MDKEYVRPLHIVIHFVNKSLIEYVISTIVYFNLFSQLKCISIDPLLDINWYFLRFFCHCIFLDFLRVCLQNKISIYSSLKNTKYLQILQWQKNLKNTIKQSQNLSLTMSSWFHENLVTPNLNFLAHSLTPNLKNIGMMWAWLNNKHISRFCRVGRFDTHS